MELLLVIQFRNIKNDTYCKEVIDAVEATLLFLHLLPDAVNALGTALHVVFEPCSVKFLCNRTNKPLYIGITALLCGIQVVLNHVVGIMLKVFQREVLQFTLQLVQSQLMSQRCIEIACLFRDTMLGLNVLSITYLSHEVHSLSNHYQDNPHVLSKGEQQVTEVLTLYDRVFLV